MNTVGSKFNYTIISFESTTDSPANPFVQSFVQKFAAECTALIVDRPEDERTVLESKPVERSEIRRSRIAEEIRSKGIKMQLQLLAFEDAIEQMQTAPKTNVSVILQPHHPLDRQSPGFRRLSYAADRAHGATIYFPEEIRAEGNVILLAGQDFNEDMLSFAQTLSSQSTLDLDFARDINNLKSLATKLLSMPSPIRPVLVLVDQPSLNVRPTELMKMAAVTGVAILSYRHVGV